MQNERAKWVSCKRGFFPDALIPLNPSGTYRRSHVTELVIAAQKLCGAQCPADCGFRQVAESIQNIKEIHD